MSNEGRNSGKFQIIADIVMGVLYIGIALWILFAKRFGQVTLTGPLAWAFAGLLVVYGTFRLYRGMVAMRMSKGQ